MAQNAPSSYVTPGGASLVTTGGLFATYNITAAKVIKASAGRVAKIVVIAPGSTSGAFTLNDAATIGAAAAGNEIWTLLFGATANVAGAVFTLDWPCANGIVVSAVPGGGSPVLAISWS